MPWLTDLLGLPVVDPSGSPLGGVRDGAASRGRFPRVVGVTLGPEARRRDGDGAGRFIPWEALHRAEGRFVADPHRLAEHGGARPTGVELGADVLDCQIVDIDGARVVRVNDVWLAESAGSLRVVGADVGLRGVLRRLGLERAIGRVAEALGYRLPERLIAWNYVAPLDGDDRAGLRLTVPTHLLRELHPSELADILDQLDAERRERILRVLSDAALAETLAETERETSSEAIEAIGPERARRIVEIMPPDEAADLLGAIGYERAERLLSLMGVRRASVLRELLGHRPDTAGGRMTPSFVAIPSGSTVQAAIDRIRAEAPSVETIYYSYVLDADGVLQGVLSLRQLLRTHPGRTVDEVMERDVVAASVEDDQEDVARTMSRYDLLALPVVDEHRRLRGIVTVDDVVDVIEEEASEDLSEVTGVYLGEGPGVRSGRLAGFGVSLVAGLAAALLLDARAGALALAVVAPVAWLLPLYLRMAQDLGTWSLARALSAAAHAADRDRRALAGETMHEVLAALASAAWSGLLVSVLGAWWAGSWAAGAFLGVGIFVGSMVAAVVGLGAPWVLRRTRLHGALARGRPLTVLVGLASLVVYAWALGALAGRIP